jgi:hypothetical protein
MLRSFQTPPSEPLPEAIFVELVDMLFVTVQPVVALGVVILLIGGAIAVARRWREHLPRPEAGGARLSLVGRQSRPRPGARYDE